MKLADDPSDPVWRWFVLNGPHGERFKWGRNRHVGFSDVELLAEFIDERDAANPQFKERARQISLTCLQSEDRILVRTAIQVLTVLGTNEDLKLIIELIDCGDPDIENDAKCALFERGIRIRKSK